MLDISDTLQPNSDQLDAIDLLGSGPRTFTIVDVSRNNGDQPINIKLAEFPRVWRPGKSMRRVLAYCWTNNASTWIGRRVTLYCDERVKFGNDVTGGTRISHLSHIDGPKSVPLLVSRGKAATFKVQPLAEPTADETVASLRAEWKTADADRRKVIEAEVKRLSEQEASEPTDEDFAAMNAEAGEP